MPNATCKNCGNFLSFSDKEFCDVFRVTTILTEKLNIENVNVVDLITAETRCCSKPDYHWN